MKLKPTTLLGFAASAAVTTVLSAGLAHATPAAPAFQSEAASGESEACQCTCAACVAKHGAKAAESTEAEKVVEVIEAPVPSASPELPTDIDAEVARVLALELDQVDALLEDVTNAEQVVVLTDVTNTLKGIGYASDVRERGYMGISLDRSSQEVGAVVDTVAPGSPAQGAGLMQGDVIITAEEMPVESGEELIAALIELKVGDTATLEVERDGTERTVTVKLVSQASIGAAAPAQIIAEIAEDADEEVVLVLPSEPQKLMELGYGGGEDVEEEVEEIEDNPAVIRWVIEEEEEEVSAPAEPERRYDPLPEGYIEIETRRERRPASDAALRERVERLERQVAELSRIVDEMRAELDRRNPN